MNKAEISLLEDAQEHLEQIERELATLKAHIKPEMLLNKNIVSNSIKIITSFTTMCDYTITEVLENY